MGLAVGYFCSSKDCIADVKDANCFDEACQSLLISRWSDEGFGDMQLNAGTGFTVGSFTSRRILRWPVGANSCS
jgi:hypothetical protein